MNYSNEWWNHLEDAEEKVVSQNGEDGVIKRIFDCIGALDRFCVEIGSGSGHECNTRRLIEQDQWTGLLLDKSGCGPRVQQEWITAENVNSVLARYDVPKTFDLLSIDVDGSDYWIWKSLQFEPRVVVIEYNPSLPPCEPKTIEYSPNFQWDGKSDYFGASLSALHSLGKRKGYTLVYCNRSGVNAFFVRTTLVPGISARSIETVFRPSSLAKPGKPHRIRSKRPWCFLSE